MVTSSFVLRMLAQLQQDHPIGSSIVLTVRLLPHMPHKGFRILGRCKSGVDQFEIQICHTLCEDEAILTILHEYRHAMQFVDGSLTIDGPQLLWHGRSYLHKRYLDQPWEIDARAWAEEQWEEYAV